MAKMANCKLCGREINMRDAYSTFGWRMEAAFPLCEKCFNIVKPIADAAKSGDAKTVESLGQRLNRIYRNDVARIIISEYEKHCQENSAAWEAEHGSDNLLTPLDELRQNLLVTTGYGFEGYRITKYLGLVSGGAVIGSGLVTDLSTLARDVVGGFSLTLSDNMLAAKNEAINQMLDRCIELDGNAVIGVSTNIATISQNMLAASADGTAVFVEKLEP